MPSTPQVSLPLNGHTEEVNMQTRECAHTNSRTSARTQREQTTNKHVLLQLFFFFFNKYSFRRISLIHMKTNKNVKNKMEIPWRNCHVNTHQIFGNILQFWWQCY